MQTYLIKCVQCKQHRWATGRWDRMPRTWLVIGPSSCSILITSEYAGIQHFRSYHSLTEQQHILIHLRWFHMHTKLRRSMWNKTLIWRANLPSWFSALLNKHLVSCCCFPLARPPNATFFSRHHGKPPFNLPPRSPQKHHCCFLQLPYVVRRVRKKKTVQQGKFQCDWDSGSRHHD